MLRQLTFWWQSIYAQARRNPVKGRSRLRKIQRKPTSNENLGISQFRVAHKPTDSGSKAKILRRPATDYDN